MDDALRQKIQTTIGQSGVVLFMKGSKIFPQCGFSARVVQMLKELNVDFRDVNILQDPELREGLKEYSSWPTFPQLYVDGKLVGGCDIVSELYQSGELKDLVAKS